MAFNQNRYFNENYGSYCFCFHHFSCYLALGETENASKSFMKCLQEGSDTCVDRKLLVEASEGLEKVQVCNSLGSLFMTTRQVGILFT